MIIFSSFIHYKVDVDITNSHSLFFNIKYLSGVFRMVLQDKYEVVSRLKANDKIPVTKYRSARTGLTVTVAQVEGPVVNGYFCLATEAHDDDGLPHTLEHLVFMGSEVLKISALI